MNAFDGRAVRIGEIEFDRRAEGLTGLVIKGYLLTLVTFSIYRFWYITDLRRFFWSRTVVAGSPAEYLGRGKELFLGFLVALAILVPIYLALFTASVAVPELAPFAAPISFVALFLLGQFAIFRGRRYRASRTRWRGIRLGQDGSALAYMGQASLWWIATLLSLGLAFPFMRAALERYRIEHTLLGQGRMRSEASGRAILGPWLLLYGVGLLPILTGLIAFLVANDFSVPLDLLIPDPDNDAGGLIFNPDYEDTSVAVYAGAVAVASAVSIPLALLLYPYYRARETRAFVRATSLGAARLTSSLRARQFYWPYILYFLAILAFVIVVGLLFAILRVIVIGQGGSGVGQLSGIYLMTGIVAYLAFLLGSVVLYVRVVTVRLWHAMTSTTTIENVDALEAVLASARGPGSALNEGLADALDVGGAVEIGF